MSKQDTGLRDSAGTPICIGDRVRRPVTGNVEFHGAWSVYEVALRGMTPVLSYVTSEKGQQLPVGYVGCVLADLYDPEIFLWATDLLSIRPMDDEVLVLTEGQGENNDSEM